MKKSLPFALAATLSTLACPLGKIANSLLRPTALTWLLPS